MFNLFFKKSKPEIDPKAKFIKEVKDICGVRIGGVVEFSPNFQGFLLLNDDTTKVVAPSEERMTVTDITKISFDDGFTGYRGYLKDKGIVQFNTRDGFKIDALYFSLAMEEYGLSDAAIELWMEIIKANILVNGKAESVSEIPGGTQCSETRIEDTVKEATFFIGLFSRKATDETIEYAMIELRQSSVRVYYGITIAEDEITVF